MINRTSGTYAGQTGELSKAYDVQNRRYQKNQSVFGRCSFYGNLIMNGVNEEKYLQREEKAMGYEKGSLSWGNSVASDEDENEILFQDSKGNFTIMDFDNGTYSIQSEKTLTESFGFDWSNGKPYDVMTIDQGGLNFYDYVSTGLGDGVQDSFGIYNTKMSNIKWGKTSYIQQELDTSYWGYDDGTAESYKSHNAWSVLQGTSSQFMSAKEARTLNSISGYTNYATAYAELVNNRLL